IMGQLTLFPEDSPVSLTVSQGSEKVRKMIDISGLKCLEQYGKLGRAGLWGKTFSELLIGMGGWYSKRCRLTWRLKGTKYNRTYFQLVPSTLPTEGIGFGLLPTATAQDFKRRGPNSKQQ